MKLPFVSPDKCKHVEFEEAGECDVCDQLQAYAELSSDPLAEIWLAVMSGDSAGDQCDAVYEVLNKHGWRVP